MKATHGRRLLNGDIANLSIGQGDLLVTPLQMAQAMAIVANGGTFYQTRLVQQVQTVDNEIVTAYQVREKKTLDASARTMEQLHTAWWTQSTAAPAPRTRQAWKMFGRRENRNGAMGPERTRSARRHGSPASCRPNIRNMPSPRFTKSEVGSNVTADQPPRR